MGVLHISLFGNIEITHDDRQSAGFKLTRTTQSLLAFILLERHRTHPREILSNLFWADYDEKRARNCLNTALWRLRKALEPDGVPKGTYLLTNHLGDVGFNCRSQHWLDVDVFENQMTQLPKASISTVTEDQIRQIEETIALYDGDLLEGFYEDWALREREHLRQLYLNGLAFLMQFYEYTQDYETSLSCGRRILEIEPLREEIHRELMRIYLQSGQRAQASRQFEICRTLLMKELGIPPMEETLVQYAKIAAPDRMNSRVSSENLAYLQQAVDQLRHATRTFTQAQQELQQALETFEDLLRRG